MHRQGADGFVTAEVSLSPPHPLPKEGLIPVPEVPGFGEHPGGFLVLWALSGTLCSQGTEQQVTEMLKGDALGLLLPGTDLCATRVHLLPQLGTAGQ